MTAFLLALAAIFLAAAACGSIAVRLRLPRVVGEMSAGLLLGQSILGHAWPRAENYLFGSSVLETLKPVGLLVVLMYVALVGAELDRSVLRGRSRNFVGAVAIGFAVATGGAAVLGVALSDLEPQGVPRWTYFVFLSGALLVTAVPVLARILDECGLTKTRVGAVTLTLSIADDFIAFSMVALAIAVATHGSVALALAGTAVLAAFVVAWKFAKRVRTRIPQPRAVSAVTIGLLALAAGSVESLGASSLVAAFIVGALLWRPAPPASTLQGGDLIRALVPLYIVYAALSVDISRLATPRLAFGILLVTAVAIFTKLVACLIAGRLLRLDRRESISLAVLRNTRGLTELVALNLGYQAGLLSQDLYTIFFAMALLTTAASGAVAMRALRPLERESARLAHEGRRAAGGTDPLVAKSAPARP
jgi:Kef-type K+ transport system membrane component KefB